MISPQQIWQKGMKHWQSGRLLSAYLRGENLFPLEIPFRKPSAKEVLERFSELRPQVTQLRAKSKEQLGYGYSLEFTSVNHRQLGQQQLPRNIRFDSREDLLRSLGKQAEFERVCTLVAATLQQQSALEGWLSKNPLMVFNYQQVWPQLILVCDHFCQLPQPARYLRELEIAGVDSKFIERHKGILAELLEQILPAGSINREITGLSGSGFERRFGLRFDEPLIRLRILDPQLAAPFGASDLSLPLSQFGQLQPDCRRIFITENKINGLSFPPVPGAWVIFGLGYGIQTLKEIDWLRTLPIDYWGDIDTHGFAILSQLRGYFPQTESMLMDWQTLLAFQHLWVAEEQSKRCLAALPHLDAREQALYHELRRNSLGENVRLEQERIAFSRLRDWLEKTGRATPGSH